MAAKIAAMTPATTLTTVLLSMSFSFLEVTVSWVVDVGDISQAGEVFRAHTVVIRLSVPIGAINALLEGNQSRVITRT